jgi:iron complex transport system ATP-binding protein
LAAEVFVERGFERITESTYQSALQQLKFCDTVVNCLTSYGEMNEKNKELLDMAASLGLRILETAEAL